MQLLVFPAVSRQVALSLPSKGGRVTSPTSSLITTSNLHLRITNQAPVPLLASLSRVILLASL